MRCVNAKVRRWSEVRFDSIKVESAERVPWADTGPGAIRLGTPEVSLAVEGLTLTDEFLKEVPFLSALPDSVVKKPVVFDKLKVVIVRRRGEFSTIHVIECSSKNLSVRGGLRMEEGQVRKAHALLSLAMAVSDQFPEALESRMSHRRKGWGEIKLIFSKNILTVLGPNGPLLKAQWQTPN